MPIFSDQKRSQTPATSYAVPATGLPLSRAQTNVPEYNDCQRFVVGQKYGSLVAIFAAYKLDSVAAELDSLAALQDSTEVVHAKRVRAVAEIYNQGPDAYAPMGIMPGFSCLRFYWNGSTPFARLQHVGDKPIDCLAEYNPAIPGFELAVKVTSLSGSPPFVDTDFPPVARWDWDFTNRQQYIGILCGTRKWCEVGPKNFVPSPGDMTTIPAPTDPEARVRRIKGWYDEQQMDLGTAGSLAPSSVHAAVIPHPRLASYTEANYAGRWETTGYVALDANLPQYLTKLNITSVPVGAPLSRMNTIEMCKGTREQCAIRQSSLHFNSKCTPAIWESAATNAQLWWARIRSAADRATNVDRYKFFCVVRREHKDNSGLPLGVPGTARWRWLDDDPAIWESCISGCCEVQAKSK